jgi:hypothetical protein
MTAPGGEAFPLPSFHRGGGAGGGDRRHEEDEAGEEWGAPQTLLARLPVAVREQLNRLVTNYTQPPEWPFPSIEARMATRVDQFGWASYVGAAVTAVPGEEDGEGRRRIPRDTDPAHSMRTYQRMSNKPEPFFRSRLPRVSLNTLMRLLVNGTERSFNPLHFVLMPERLRAIERGDAGMRAPFPFFRERAVPLTQTSQLDLERGEYQQVIMDSYNRVLGGLDRVWQGDPEMGTQHLLDALFVLMHYGAEIEARRRAEERVCVGGTAKGSVWNPSSRSR